MQIEIASNPLVISFAIKPVLKSRSNKLEPIIMVAKICTVYKSAVKYLGVICEGPTEIWNISRPIKAKYKADKISDAERNESTNSAFVSV